ncbi:MAG: hypothetical protein R2779_04950 [Crocinitomicaceae bacterium]
MKQQLLKWLSYQLRFVTFKHFKNTAQKPYASNMREDYEVTAVRRLCSNRTHSNSICITSLTD